VTQLTKTYIYVTNIHTHRLFGFAGELSFEVDLFGTLLLRFRENLKKNIHY